jgi:toxin FitB
MIILDTNVLSELMRPTPDALVVAWLDAQAAESIWLTSVTVFEVRMALAPMPKGKRRRTLEEGFQQLLAQDLDHRALPFDTEAAAQAALVGAARQQAGPAVDVRDSQIAGLAIARRATLATRNLRHFADLPIPVLSPWAE